MSGPSLSSLSGDSSDRSTSSRAAPREGHATVTETRPLRTLCDTEFYRGSCTREHCKFEHNFTSRERSVMGVHFQGIEHKIWPDSETSQPSGSQPSPDRRDIVPAPVVGTDREVREGGDSASLRALGVPSGTVVSENQAVMCAPNTSEFDFPVFLRSTGKMSREQLIQIIPKDEFGRPTSLGAILHARGRCKPCLKCYAVDGNGCIDGVRCRFCHFRHGETSQPHRSQPGKRDRDAFKQAFLDVEAEIHANPHAYSVDECVHHYIRNKIIKPRFEANFRAKIEACMIEATRARGSAHA